MVTFKLRKQLAALLSPQRTTVHTISACFVRKYEHMKDYHTHKLWKFYFRNRLTK
jgi:hypothetical protein